jgi:MFS family permease
MTDETPQRVTPYAWYALGLLTLVYILNFLDRTLIYLMFQPIKKEIGLSDTQLALLGATAFAIFYTTLGLPFGRLADKVSRVKLIAAGLAVWSLFSGLTGFCHSFWTLFFCRMMVGVGEATLGPAALSLISDYFPPERRATVQALYTSGIAVGAGLAFLLGGQLEPLIGWRKSFYLLGFPGLLVAVLVWFLREKPRGAMETSAPRLAGADWRVLFASPPLRCLYLGYALCGLASNSLSIWGATFFVRNYGVKLPEIGNWAGIASLVVGVPGTVLGGFLSDKLRRFGRGGRMGFGALVALLAAPLWVAMLYAPRWGVLLPVYFLLLAMSVAWVAPAAADVHDIAGPNLRGLGVAIFFFAVNFAAYGLGAPLIGKLSDSLGAATNPSQMRLALLVCPAACLLGAFFLWRGRQLLQKASAER